jgi:hypothetical protein
MLDLEHMIRQEQIERVANVLWLRMQRGPASKPWVRLSRARKQPWIDHAEAALTAAEEARYEVEGSTRKPRMFGVHTSQP